MQRHESFWQRTLWLCFALSLLLHTMVFVLLPRRPNPTIVQKRLHLQAGPRFKPQLFSGGAPEAGPPALERLVSPAFMPLSTQLRLPEAAPLSQSEISQLSPLDTEVLLAPPKADRFLVQEVELPDLDSLAFDALVKTAAEYEAFARFHTFDADTTDAESQLRRRARQVVERAIAAMGGRPALLAIKALKARVWFEAWEHVSPKGDVRTVPLYVYPVETWHFKGWDRFVRQGVRIPQNLASMPVVEPYMLRNPAISMGNYFRLFGPQRWTFLSASFAQLRIQGEAGRWHFIDRFLGEGVALEYIGTERFKDGQSVEVIRVNDRKYGHFFEAFFSRRSGLLYAVREGLVAAEERRYRQTYKKPAPVWTTLYGDYRSVQRVLLPHKLARRGPLCPTCRRQNQGMSTAHFKIALNGAEPDSSAPDF